MARIVREMRPCCPQKVAICTFLLGVQWHPEHLVFTQQEAAKLFAAFVEACR